VLIAGTRVFDLYAPRVRMEGWRQRRLGWEVCGTKKLWKRGKTIDRGRPSWKELTTLKRGTRPPTSPSSVSADLVTEASEVFREGHGLGSRAQSALPISLLTAAGVRLRVSDSRQVFNQENLVSFFAAYKLVHKLLSDQYPQLQRCTLVPSPHLDRTHLLD